MRGRASQSLRRSPEPPIGRSQAISDGEQSPSTRFAGSGLPVRQRRLQPPIHLHSEKGDRRIQHPTSIEAGRCGGQGTFNSRHDAERTLRSQLSNSHLEEFRQLHLQKNKPATMYRSTKASKARQDRSTPRSEPEGLAISDHQISAALIPAHHMSLACMYTRKSVFFTQELMQSAAGLSDAADWEGLLYLSDSVSEAPRTLRPIESPTDLIHFVDLVAQGTACTMCNLRPLHRLGPTCQPRHPSETDRLFRCRFPTPPSPCGGKALGTSWCVLLPSGEPHPTRSGQGRGGRPPPLPWLRQLVPGLLLLPAQPGHESYQTARQCERYLGFDVTALRSRSWCSLLHPQDLSHASRSAPQPIEREEEGQSWIIVSLRPEMIVNAQLRADPMTLVLTAGSSGLSYQSFDFSTAGTAWAPLMNQGSSAAETTMQLEVTLAQYLLTGSFFQQHPPRKPLGCLLPHPVTVETVADLDFFDPEHSPRPPSARPSAASSPPLPWSHLTSSADQRVSSASPHHPLYQSSPRPSYPIHRSPHPRRALQWLLSASPTPDSPGDGDCTVMTLPEVRGPLYVDVPLGPLQCPPEGLLTPEASPGKQPCLSFFSLEREREKERAEISLLAQHISSLAEGFYLDPLLSRLSPPSMSPSSSPPSPFLSPTIETTDVDSVHMLREFYPIKAWRGLDIPIFLDDDDSLFEESILETLLQDDFAPSQSPGLSSPSPCTSPMPNPSSPTSPQTPVCWRQPSQFEGVGHFCSVQSAQCNSMAGCRAAQAAEAGVKAEGEGLAEEAMEIEVVSSPVSSCSSIPASPPLILTASPSPTTSMPIASPTPAVSCTQSLLEELAVLEPMFGAGASIAPGLGQQPELYQLQCHPSPQCFHKDGSGSVPPF
ncbi:neuronal PAS domain-containing protein 4 [Lates japonicus]|uniref:Neuronal PAS domain-containing protein 4 n=1 Tax=Lates japonicus TaxID=270547 RepID=A0AAD3NFM1_LATJO|nr:neuronal PAS domain-containing protein 4 [Lates japonicus]